MENDWKYLILNILTIVVMISSVFMIISKDNERIEDLQETNQELYVELIETQNTLGKKLYKARLNLQKVLDSKIKQLFSYENVTITAYSPRSKETDSTPNTTALMTKPIPGGTCAVSRDLIHLLGKKIYIEGYGVFVVTDVMNKRWEYRIDLCMNTRAAKKFGKQKANVVLLDAICTVK